MSTLIRNGRIITAERDYVADLFIERDRISAIGPGLKVEADRVMDASRKYIIPGGIDVHTHLDMPLGETVSSDDFETGTRAAAFGGTTCVIDFANQARGKRIWDALDTWRKKAEKATIDYSFHMTITDLPEAHLEDMDGMVREGITSFKLFMAYPNTLMVDDATIYRVMKQTARCGGLVCIHAENGNMIEPLIQQAIAEGKTAPVNHALTRPTAAEAEAVHRAITIARKADTPVYIVHVSCAEALERIGEARDGSFPVFAETCPHYLLLSVEELQAPDFEGAKYVLTPPLREKWHQEKLWEGLARNWLQVVSTDHCPFHFRGQKELGRSSFARIPNGGPGIENRLHLLYHHGVNRKRMTLNRWVEIVSSAPARLFGLYPRKGAIAAGSDADIVVWDPQKRHTISARTHHMRVDYSLYEGFEVQGDAESVFSRGDLVVDNGRWLGQAGRGQFIRREPCSEVWK